MRPSHSVGKFDGLAETIWYSYPDVLESIYELNVGLLWVARCAKPTASAGQWHYSIVRTEINQVSDNFVI
jgi:hypothetical protein